LEGQKQNQEVTWLCLILKKIILKDCLFLRVFKIFLNWMKIYHNQENFIKVFFVNKSLQCMLLEGLKNLEELIICINFHIFPIYIFQIMWIKVLCKMIFLECSNLEKINLFIANLKWYLKIQMDKMFANCIVQKV